MDINKELYKIAESLRVLKAEGVIRSNLVGDLGEYYCKEYCNIVLCDAGQKGFDGYNNDKKRIQIKTRSSPTSKSKIIFKNLDFDYCYFVELNDFLELVLILKISRDDIVKNLETKSLRLTVSKIKKYTNFHILFQNNKAISY